MGLDENNSIFVLTVSDSLGRLHAYFFDKTPSAISLDTTGKRLDMSGASVVGVLDVSVDSATAWFLVRNDY